MKGAVPSCHKPLKLTAEGYEYAFFFTKPIVNWGLSPRAVIETATMDSELGRVVFIDTNLDTHLALTVFTHDAVVDLKRKILSEHPKCFPKIGQIQIHGIKVKRKGYFYHLSDSMLVRSALNPFHKSWFLSADVSALGDCRQNELLFSDRVESPGIANDNALVGTHDNAIRLLQLENKWDESEQIPVGRLRVAEHIAKGGVTNLEGGVKSHGDNGTGTPVPVSIPETEDHRRVNQEVPSSRIEGEVDGSGKGNTDEPSISVQSVKRKRKSKKRKKEDSVGVDNSKDNIASVGNPLSCQRASSFNNLPVPQPENRHDEKEEIQGPCVLERTRKGAVKHLEMDVKSSGNNDRDALFPSSIAERQDNCSLNHQLPNSLTECEVDGSNKGIKDDCTVGEEGTSKLAPSPQKKHKSKKRKKEDTVQDGTSKENDTYVVVPGDYTVQQDVVVLGNSSEKAVKEVIKETEVLKEHLPTECNDNNTKNDIDAVLMKEASEPRSAVIKKHKKRKTCDSRELLKVETASQKDAAQISHEAHVETKESKGQSELNNDKSGDDVECKHNKTEDILDTRPPAKKRKKSKKKSRGKSLSNKNLANDLGGDKSSPHLLKDQPNIKNSSADQLAENFDGADQLETSVLGQGKKGTMNSSDLDEAPIVTLSRDNEEEHHSSIQREDIIMSKTTVDKMEIGTEACKVSSQSTVKRKGSDIEMNVPSSDVNEPKDLTDDNENVVLGHCNEREAGQTEGAEEGKEVLPSNKVNTNSGIRELKTTSNVEDVNGMNKPVKSDKKVEGTKKDKNSGAELALKEVVGPVDASESETVIAKSLKATIRDPTLQNTETDENPLNQTEGKKIQQQEMPGAVLSVTDKENDFSADNAGFPEHIKTKANAENVDKHVDKRLARKSNNKQPSTPKRSPKMLTKDQVLDVDSKKEHDVQTIPAGKKVPNAPKTRHGSKLSSQSDSAMSSIDENRKLRNNASGKSMDLERQREQFPISKSNLKVSNKMVQNKARKASRNNVGGVVSKTQPNTSLLGGAIFDDNSSGTSEGEDQVDYSDASTRTPSDNSLLSDFSDGNSQQNGSSWKRLENGERSSLKAGLSGRKGMSIDRVLRSSARYKIAKITASQMDESESQPEFVPDSLPS